MPEYIIAQGKREEHITAANLSAAKRKATAWAVWGCQVLRIYNADGRIKLAWRPLTFAGGFAAWQTDRMYAS